MCNQFHSPALQELRNYLINYLKLPLTKTQLDPNLFNAMAFPQSKVAVLLYAQNKLQLRAKKWGYPALKGNNVIFNARIERFYDGTESMWDESFAKRRCIILTDQFFESGRQYYQLANGKKYKQRFALQNTNSKLTMIAGIYEDDHFALVTTKPNKTMSKIHDRMPLILEENELRHYLFQNFTDLIDRERIKLSYSRKK